MNYAEAVQARETADANYKKSLATLGEHQRVCPRCRRGEKVVKVGNLFAFRMGVPPPNPCDEGKQLLAENEHARSTMYDAHHVFDLPSGPRWWSAHRRGVKNKYNPQGMWDVKFYYAVKATPLGWPSWSRDYSTPTPEVENLRYHKTRRAAKDRAWNLYLSYIMKHQRDNQKEADRLLKKGWLVEAEAQTH